MSVVNKMLRDLESREAQQAASADYVPQRNVRPWIILGALMLVSLSVAATYAVSTAFIQDAHKGKSEPTDSQIEKLPTDRYVVIDTKKIQASQEQHANLQNETLAITAQQQFAGAESMSEYSNENSPAIKSELNHPDPKISKNKSDFQNQATAVVSKDKDIVVLDDETKANEHLITGYVTETDNQNISVLAKGSQTQPSFKINKQHKDATQQPARASQTLSIKPSDGSKQQLSNLRAQAHIESKAGNDFKVIQVLTEILVLAPSDQKTRKQLATLLFSKGRIEEASRILHDGLALAPAESSLRLMLARAYFKSGNTEHAYDVLNQHPYQQIASDELLSFRAAIAEKLGNYKQAQSDYQTLVNRNPAQAKWWLGLGVAQDKQKLVAQAINSYQQAKALNQLPVQVDSFVSKRIQLLTRES